MYVYPYGDSQQLNLDWVIEKLKELGYADAAAVVDVKFDTSGTNGKLQQKYNNAYHDVVEVDYTPVQNSKRPLSSNAGYDLNTAITIQLPGIKWQRKAGDGTSSTTRLTQWGDISPNDKLKVVPTGTQYYWWYFLNANDQYVSYATDWSNNEQILTAPDTAVKFCVVVKKDESGTAEFLPEQIATYVYTMPTINNEINKIEDGISDVNTAIKAFKVIHVNSDGTGNYTTINAAINAALDNDIIIIHPGTYNESVKNRNKKLNIWGVDRDSCIIQYSGLDYNNPPIEIAKGSLKNLTIKALNSGTAGDSFAYCQHTDFNTEENETLDIENVHYIHPFFRCVGIGLRHNYTLHFKNCSFDAEDEIAFYCHDWEGTGDHTNQKVIVENCLIRNNSATKKTILLQSQELATDCATCEFVQCSVTNENANGEKIGMLLWSGRTLTNNSFMGSSDWQLSNISSLNTVKELNATGYPLSMTDWNLFNRFQYFRPSASNPVDLPVRRYNGGMLLANLQGAGFTMLSLYQDGNNVYVKDIVTGNAFTNTHFTFTINGYEYITMAQDYTDPSTVMLIAPNVVT